ncbi:MAG: diaminopimelate epimerase [Gemmatimonadales bacterium]|jgi:diaminopimelate epimerase
MRQFYKMSGSGNDFVFVDARDGDAGEWVTPERIREVCARGTGVGADGIVVVGAAPAGADIGIRYFNADGSLGELCGNATLCTVRLAAVLGLDPAAGLRIATDAGIMTARMASGLPEFDLGAVTRVETEPPIERAAGERRIGYAMAGVPHLVVLVDGVGDVDVAGRGRALRFHAAAGAAGANVNFVAPARGNGARDGDWVMRTYERGVEGETLACGTGSVAASTLLRAWGLAAESPVRLWTRSGLPLDVTVTRSGQAWSAALRGEARLVFRGELIDV